MNHSFTPDLKLLAQLLSTAPDTERDESARAELRERTWLINSATDYVQALARLNTAIDALLVPLLATVAAFLDEVQR